MSKTDIIRAWKDEDYRESLDEAQLAEHPAGIVELSEEELSEVQGGVLPNVSLNRISTFCLACQR